MHKWIAEKEGRKHYQQPWASQPSQATMVWMPVSSSRSSPCEWGMRNVKDNEMKEMYQNPRTMHRRVTVCRESICTRKAPRQASRKCSGMVSPVPSVTVHHQVPGRCQHARGEEPQLLTHRDVLKWNLPSEKRKRMTDLSFIERPGFWSRQNAWSWTFHRRYHHADTCEMNEDITGIESMFHVCLFQFTVHSSVPRYPRALVSHLGMRERGV